MYFLGIDLGSSSIKVALVDAHNGQTCAIVQYPTSEMAISSPQQGWAEQSPDDWWANTCVGVQKLLAQTGISPKKIQGIGISYQMHGLVCVDAAGKPIRPAIIWCDSRAVGIGEQARNALGNDWCLSHCLNAPGNFTAAKLAWVRAHEPENFKRIWKICLPGDYLAFRMTGEMGTTISGLSEGIFWDFKENTLAQRVLDFWHFDQNLIPNRLPTFGLQGKLSAQAARELGLAPDTPVTYRAGDQPDNALSLHVLRPGEVAATGGTSGVMYAVTDALAIDEKQRVNCFAHVNHSAENPRIGVLLCINGAGSAYAWLRKNTMPNHLNYNDLEQMAAQIPAGSDGLKMIPFGNGVERMLGNKTPGGQFIGLDFNRHEKGHLVRATLEGIAFAFAHGAAALREMGIRPSVLRVGNDNLFQSTIFSETLATLLDVQIEMLESTGAVGAALAAGMGEGAFDTPEKMFASLKRVRVFEPNNRHRAVLNDALEAATRLY